jgi:hypothetical protein
MGVGKKQREVGVRGNAYVLLIGNESRDRGGGKILLEALIPRARAERRYPSLLLSVYRVE